MSRRLIIEDTDYRGGPPAYCEPSRHDILVAALPLMRDVLASDELAFAVADELRIGGSAIAAVLRVLEEAGKP